MNFKDFLCKTKSSIQAFYGEKAHVEIKEVAKNNGVILNGLVITEDKENISPTIYLDSFYEAFCKGEAFAKIMEEIIQIYDENKIKTPVNMDFFLDYNKVKGRIFIKVINYEKNKEMLQQLPHKQFLDLAIVVYYAYMNDFFGRGSIQITISHLDRWGISEEELFSDAGINTREKLGVEILCMRDILSELISVDDDREDSEQIDEALSYVTGDTSMHVMTVKGRYFGAACICENEMLYEFANRCKRDFYILPSSIHELILIPDTGLETADGLRRMVKEVNAEHVDREEQLSDNIYYFDSVTKKVAIV